MKIAQNSIESAMKYYIATTATAITQTKLQEKCQEYQKLKILSKL